MMEQDQRKGALCGLLAAGIRMEGLLRVAIERPDAEPEVGPQIREAFELYKKIFESVWAADAASLSEPVQEDEYPEDIPAMQPETEPAEAVAEAPEEPVAESEPEPEPEIEIAEEPEEKVSPDAPQAPSVEPEVLKLDELIARRESACLRRAFTLNDKFRFRRTLFGGSNEAFSDVLDRLEAMTDGHEAQRYMAALIDVESEDGAAFMNIVNAHFGIKQ